MLHGLADLWPARTRWGFGQLAATFGESKLRCGEDDSGHTLKCKVRCLKENTQLALKQQAEHNASSAL